MRRLTVFMICFMMMSGSLALPSAIAVQDSGSVDARLCPSPPWSENKNSDPAHARELGALPKPTSPFAAVTGTAKVLIILINFNDTTNSSLHTPKYFEDLLLNTSQNSMARFFNDNSFNLYNITGNVTTKFYTASHNESFYGMYETSSPPVNGYGNSQNLTKEAVQAADTDINFADFDTDSDGNVDHLIIVHAGKDDANDGDGTGPGGDPQLWSHAWALNANAVQLDGKWCNKYVVLSEDDPVGVYVHEYGHDLGLPDLYDTDYSSDGGVGNWDVMAQGNWNNGGNTPASLSAWCKKELGWLIPAVVSVNTATLQGKRAEDNQTAFKVWVNFSNNEYFLVENRQQVGWDASVPGNGLLIWHINETASGNTNDNFRLVDLEEADNNNNAKQAADSWKSSATGMTPTTGPNTNDYSGKGTGIRIFNISASGNLMTFDVWLGNTAPNAPTPTNPGDNSWTNLSKPTLNWTFSDPDGGDIQTAYRLEIDDVSGFGSINWDSGEVASAANNQTVSAALAEGKWYWRVRTRDTGGLWGSNSALRSFNIDLTAPAAPTGPSATPSGWSGTDMFSIDWSYPSESGTSGIASGIYYKVDNAPSGPADGTWSSSKPVTGVSVGTSGTHTIYIWLKDNVANINATNRTTVTVYYDATAPTNPTAVNGTTHLVGGWRNVAIINVNWSGAADSHSGVDGFSFLWDENPSTLPDTAKDSEETLNNTTSAALADGLWYFHIRTRDNVGNWAAVAIHLGPFGIDTVNPQGVTGASSTSHITDQWTNRSTIAVQWWGATDDRSGIGGYSILWDSSALSIPDDAGELNGGATCTTSPALADGAGYYFHIRVKDAAGNWNATAFHLGPFRIDNTPPANPGGYVIGSNHTIGNWSGARFINVTWTLSTDALSGLDGFSYIWDGLQDTIPDNVKDVEELECVAQSPKLASGIYYLHLRVRDNAGNWNATAFHIGPFRIDADLPVSTAAADEGNHTGVSSLKWTWESGQDAHSGVAGYLVTLGTAPGTNDIVDGAFTDALEYTFDGAVDGKSYYLMIRTIDAVGNTGEFGTGSDGITADLSAPVNLTIAINNGAIYSNWSTVTLTLNARDALSGLSGMRFNTGGVNWTDWTAYSSSIQLIVPAGEGTRTVSFEVRDAVGNVAVAINDTIIVDLFGPKVTKLGLSGGRAIVNSLQVTIALEAEDFASAVVSMRISHDGENWGGWMPYSATAGWNLTAGDGVKSFFVQAADAAGNEGDIFEYKVQLDTNAPPKATVSSTSHPRQDSWYNTTNAALRWVAPADISGIDGYAYVLSQGNDLPGVTVTTNLTEATVKLTAGGKWYFRIKAIDGAGNWGEVAVFVMMLDNAGPKPPTLDRPASDTVLNEGPAEVAWGVSADNESGLKAYFVLVDDSADFSSPVFDGIVQGNSYSIPMLGAGNFKWKVRAQDKAGNWGDWSDVKSFKVVKPGGGGGGGGNGGLMDMKFGPLSFLQFLIVLILIVVAGVGIALAGGRKKKEPPEEKAAAAKGAEGATNEDWPVDGTEPQWDDPGHASDRYTNAPK